MNGVPPKNDDFKIVVVGDESTGKTCLITAFAENRFPSVNEPFINDSYEVINFD